MTAFEKKLLSFSVVAGLVFCVPQNASAMHIMEGYLPPALCVAWGALCLPFLTAGVISIRHLVQQRRKSVLLLAMSGAFIFVISSLKIPSVTGSCSHMTGTGLAAILFGVPAASVLGVIVLVFQAVLLAHGGLTTLGANTFSMAVAGPLLTWGIYQAGKKLGLPIAITAKSAKLCSRVRSGCMPAKKSRFWEATAPENRPFSFWQTACFLQAAARWFWKTNRLENGKNSVCGFAKAWAWCFKTRMSSFWPEV